MVRHKLVRRIVAAYERAPQRLAPELRPRAAIRARLTPAPRVLEIEVIGIDQIAFDGKQAAGLVLPTATELERLCALAIASAGIEDGHVAIEFVSAERIRELNREHRALDEPTDVLSFAIDGQGASAGPRELGAILRLSS